MDILAALVAADATAQRHCSFSELKRRAGVDDTGRFNYHLGELVGTLVVKTEAGYRLSKFSRRVLRPMTTGFYEPDLAVTNLEIPGHCPQCEAGLRVRPHEGVLQVVCEAEHAVNRGLVAPPGLLAEHDPEDAATALGLLTTHAVELATTGVCPTCHGPVSGAVTTTTTTTVTCSPRPATRVATSS